MITYITGNIFESSAECLVNTVNCEGYMGKGIAYQFKLRYPQNNRDYVRACRSGELKIGRIHSFFESGKLIVNFPTKDKWREKSRMQYVEAGLDLLGGLVRRESIKSMAVPPLGCGNGGLAWTDVKKVIDEKLSPISGICDITIFEPSLSYKAVPKEAPKLSASSLVLLQMKMHLEQWGFLRMQKAGYFVNYYLGEDYFKFDKWKYGPYSHSMDIVARGVKEYQDYYNLDNTEDTYQLAYQVVVSKRIEKKLQKLIPAIKKAAEYVNAIKNNSDLEGIATVLFLVQNEEDLTQEKLIESFKAWSMDKANRFTEEHIIQCIRYLVDTGIIEENLFGIYKTSKCGN